MEPVVAAFDVDGTLTVRDCVFPFLLQVGRGRFVVRVLAGLPRLVGPVARRDRDTLKGFFVNAALGGKTVDSVDELGERFAARVARSWMREDVATRLRWHQDQGHVVVLVSASLSPYLVPFGEILEVDAVICTELESIDGRYTGTLLGPNCRAGEKMVRLSAWAVDAGLSPEGWLRYAYGDSAGDAQMLLAAAEGVNVARQEVTT